MRHDPLALIFDGRLPCNCCGALSTPADLNEAGACGDCAGQEGVR